MARGGSAGRAVLELTPREEGVDDETGEALIQRDDDKEETVKKRLNVYHEQTEPLVGFYRALAASGAAKAPQYRTVDGIGGVEQIKQRIIDSLN